VSKAIHVDLTQVIGLNSHLNFFEKLEGKLFLDSIEIINEIEEHVPVIRKLLANSSTKHLQELVQQYLHVNKVEFYIPDSMKANWNMN
jgi:D-ribose pyranose/furanose isomerase RbsD